jgi:hypothetical protein
VHVRLLSVRCGTARRGRSGHYPHFHSVAATGEHARRRRVPASPREDHSIPTDDPGRVQACTTTGQASQWSTSSMAHGSRLWCADSVTSGGGGQR